MIGASYKQARSPHGTNNEPLFVRFPCVYAPPADISARIRHRPFTCFSIPSLDTPLGALGTQSNVARVYEPIGVKSELGWRSRLRVSISIVGGRGRVGWERSARTYYVESENTYMGVYDRQQQ